MKRSSSIGIGVQDRERRICTIHRPGGKSTKKTYIPSTAILLWSLGILRKVTRHFLCCFANKKIIIAFAKFSLKSLFPTYILLLLIVLLYYCVANKHSFIQG